MKEGKSDERIEQLEETLSQADNSPHPFFSSSYKSAIKESITRVATNSSTNDSRIPDLPVEERKRREAAAAGKAYRVPEWWRGERANYKVAKNMMGALPKRMGPVK